MNKPLAVIELDLVALLADRDTVMQTEVLPSAVDDAVVRLSNRAANALGYGGAERVLKLVRDAIARGES